MYSLDEVKKRSLRDNDQNNRKVMFLATRLSIYFSWLFVNLGITANQVTIIFFLVGLLGSILIFKLSLLYIFFGYILYRLHIILDVSDGEVARFTQKFSINGAYWDYMIHAILYPLYFFGMTTAVYYEYDNVIFLFIGTVAVLVTSLMLATKNNYFRAKFFNNDSYSDWKKLNTKVSNKKFTLFNLISLMVSFEGLFILYIGCFFIKSEFLYYILFITYILFFTLISIVKFYKFTINGYYTTRS